MESESIVQSEEAIKTKLKEMLELMGEQMDLIISLSRNKAPGFMQKKAKDSLDRMIYKYEELKGIYFDRYRV